MEENNFKDEILEEGESYAIIENSEESILAYKIENLYSDKNETIYKSKIELKKNPPILEVSSSDGDVVQFPLTKNFTNSMLRNINEVNKAHAGFKKTKNVIDFNSKEKTRKGIIIDFFKVNKLLITIFVIGIFFNIFMQTNMTIALMGTFIVAILVLLFNYNNYNSEKGDTTDETRE